MKLSFIIVNYQSEKYLTRCLSSIKEKILDIDYEIIVVNNDKSDLEAELPMATKIINVGKNIGFGRACNTGTRAAQGEILCFLNPDTEVVSKNITELIQEFNQDKSIGVLGSRLITDEGKTQWWCTGKEFNFWRLIKNNLGLIESKKIWESKEKIHVDWVSGAAMFVRKDLFQKIGGFDEKYFMYFEDEDLCRRIRNLGYKAVYYPYFIIYHAGGKSRENLFRQKMQFFKSMLVYIKKGCNT